MGNQIIGLLVVLAATCGVTPAADETGIRLIRGDNAVMALVDGQPFTTYRHGSDESGPYIRPYFYPVFAFGQVEVTADRTRDRLKDPKADHPHHRSIWVAHGSVNGVDHWGTTGEEAPLQRHVGFTDAKRIGWWKNCCGKRRTTNRCCARRAPSSLENIPTKAAGLT